MLSVWPCSIRNITNCIISEENSREYCLLFCSAKNYNYFGLQKGNWCLCGDKKPEKWRRMDQQECNMTQWSATSPTGQLTPTSLSIMVIDPWIWRVLAIPMKHVEVLYVWIYILLFMVTFYTVVAQIWSDPTVIQNWSCLRIFVWALTIFGRNRI